jgi:predicted MPP superfamily phosphohydrolase
VITRRNLLLSATAAAAGAAAFGGYAVAGSWDVALTRYSISPARWPTGLRVRLAVLADLHVCEPWMGMRHLEHIVAATNALAPDAVMLLGDYRAGRQINRIAAPVSDRDWTGVLAQLEAPLGIHAVLGNHDWWDEPELQRTRRGVPGARTALEAAGIPVYQNDATRLVKDGHPFWIAGLGDQWAFYRPRFVASGGSRSYHDGTDDLPGTLRRIGDDAPVLLMAHEPDIFPAVPDRVALTISGHTHGGQINVMGYAPVVPSVYGQRYRYGHIVEEGRNLIVSSGLGYSVAPVRIGAPSEVVVVDIGSELEVSA